MPTGTFSLKDLLRVQSQTVSEIGPERVRGAIERELSVYSAVVLDALSVLCWFTTLSQEAAGGHIDANAMEDIGEFGRPKTQKGIAPQTVGYPLRKYGVNLGWTADFLKMARGVDIAKGVATAQRADQIRLQREIQRALYTATNLSTRDTFVEQQITLGVKRFLNADGASIPVGPTGEVFDGSTETHYFGSTSAAWSSSTTANKATDLDNMLTQLIEKGNGVDMRIVINKAQATHVRGLTATTPNFIPFSDSRIEYNASDRARRARDGSRNDNVAIGYFGDATVEVKPWALAGYIFAYDASKQDQNKPLAMRQHPVAGNQGLIMPDRQFFHPLQLEQMIRYVGFGAKNRTNGVVLYTGGTSYVSPTIAT